jgi:2-phospho-L-lactate/phosphoenolpyruvate guanylyltransferase
MSVWAVVVARVGHGAKSRLASMLEPDQRHRLAMAMLDDVLSVCTSPSAGFDGVIAVVDDIAAAMLAERRGALAIRDAGGDMNVAAAAGVRAAERHGATTVLVLPGDIPLVSVADLNTLRAAAAGAPRAVVVGASRDGSGTNALLLCPPDVIAPAFGPPSVERHIRLAQAAGAVTQLWSQLGLALEVDTPADLRALADMPVGLATANFLAESSVLIHDNAEPHFISL